MSNLPSFVGDPDSRYLRKVEKEITIPSMMKRIAHKDKCPEEVKGKSRGSVTLTDTETESDINSDSLGR